MASATLEPDPTPPATPRRRRIAELRRGFAELPRPMRWTVWVSLAVVLVLLAATAAGVVVVRRSFPQTTGTIAIPGLEGRVEVVRDGAGIPQIYGDSLADIARAQGYVHAQERFFEMDVRRHATAGRLAEMFGADAVESDAVVRTMGWRRVAEQELGLIKPETRAFLEAYSAGVNAYLHTHSLSEISLEYVVLRAGGLDYTPEDWTPVDSLAWLKAMAWDLRGNMQDEIDRAISTADVGAERADALFPDYPYGDHAPIVGQGAVVDGVFDQDAPSGVTRNPTRPPFTAGQVDALRRVGRTVAAMPAWLGRGDGIGSNSWVVDGAHSATGEPLLANDPHLGVGMPGIWMQMGLHCRVLSSACPLDVAGFTFSGLPGVVIGHNNDIAWGFTNLGPDVTDLFVERVQGDTYVYAGRRQPLRERREVIKVHDGDDVVLTVRSTRHGPLLSDVGAQVDAQVGAELGDDLAAAATGSGVAEGVRPGEEAAVALRWTALDPQPTADAILDLDLATDWTSFRAAAAEFAVPAQNLVYADREGHIGYQAPGRIPIRKSGNDGLTPVAGWRPENDWSGEYVPFSGLPSVLDPDEGFVVTANQAVIGPGYPYRLASPSDWDRGYRSQRIRDLLTTRFADGGTVSIDDLLGVQLDSRNPMGPVLTPYLLDLVRQLPRGYYRAAAHLLPSWDFSQPADGPQSAAAAYFNAVWRNLLALTFDDELSSEVRPDGGQRWYAVVTALLQRPDDAWWDDVDTPTVVEHRDDILRQALLDARDELTRRMARDVSEWTWGRLHRLDLRSPTLGESGIAPIEWLVNRGPWRVGGGTSAVDAAAWDASSEETHPYEVTTAPSMRMVVSVGDWDDSRWINLTGVSGHAFSAHYDDQTDLWARGETLAWPFTADAVRAAGEDTLTLEPSDPDAAG
ncbi:penicillin acylase family protein [Nocardioides fonticola]|uniref:Penicillin acylase family protein n=1 Tax=Nocardioides fonticola TaxID=450363 RepID=A0ABP7XLI7_9ACTN